MRAFLLINESMSIYKSYITFLLCIILHSCSSEKINSETLNENALLSFVIEYNGKEIPGIIDKDNMSITLPEVEYSSDIISVEYKIMKGWRVVFEPSKWIGTWKKDEFFSIENEEGDKLNYKVILPDFVRPNERDYVVGYIPANYGKFPECLSKIKWNTLTHMNIAFVYVKSSGELIDDTVKDKISLIRDMAHKNGVKVLYSLRSDKQGEFYNAIKDENSRNRLVDNAIEYAKENGLDGIDIDYENYDKVCPKLVSFVKSLYNKKGRTLLQTCAVSRRNPIAQGGYTKEWHKYFDIINVMTYDFTGTWSSEGQHSHYDGTVNGMNMWIEEMDAPSYKLTMGLPFYGYSWDDKVFPNTPVAVSYEQILKSYPDSDVWNKDQVGRTYYNGQPTIMKKCLKAKEMKLGGVMIWQILHDTDIEKYSLMKTIGEVYNNK